MPPPRGWCGLSFFFAGPLDITICDGRGRIDVIQNAIIPMMKSWNEIRKNAAAFSKRWKAAHDEKSEAQSFLKEFFAVFGVDAVQVATFEHRVKFSDGSQGYVD